MKSALFEVQSRLSEIDVMTILLQRDIAGYTGLGAAAVMEKDKGSQVIPAEEGHRMTRHFPV